MNRHPRRFALSGPTRRSLELERSLRDREVIRRTAELFAADVPLRTIFSQFCALLARFVDASRVFVALQEDGAMRIVYLLDEASAGDAVERDLPPDSYAVEVATSGKSILKRSQAEWEEGRAQGVSAIFAPVKFGRDVIGVLAVQSSRAHAYSSADVALLETCALYLAVRIHDAGEASAKREFRDLAAVDGLCGIANRRAFDEVLRRCWDAAALEKRSLSVLLIDVDFFKPFNDRYGHVAGDACLQQIARALEACIGQEGALLARYGGEEFGAVLPSTGGPASVALAEQMRAAIATLAIPHHGSTLGVVSISVGCATMIPDGREPTVLVQRADRALYAAKGAGRNRASGANYLSAAPPAERREETRQNLPLQLTRFLGRERELRDVTSALTEPRLITLAGPGGIGKTRLAIESAQLVLDAFPDGVWFVDLAAVSDPARVEHAIAEVFEWQLAGTNPLASLAGLLRPKCALIVLDNCEHLVTACTIVVDAILRNAPRVKVLATSREALGVDGERLYRVASLTVPPPGATVTAASAGSYDALLFFASRAAAAGFELDDANAPIVAQICRRLDGIPLALELAAARLRSMSLESLAARLDDRFRILTGGSRAALPRQQTLRALIDWSFNLLDERERKLLLRLSVFAGGWTGEAAQAVCDGEGIDPQDVDDLLHSLVEKSLVDHGMEAGEGRYRFMESMREYALEALGPEAARWRMRHAAYIADVATRAELAGRTQPTRVWLPPLIPDDANFEAALEWCLEEQQDAAVGAAIAAGLTPYWEATSRTPAAALRWLERARSAQKDLPPILAAKLCLAATFFLRQASIEPQRAVALAERALAIARREGDARLAASALVNAAGAHLMRIELDVAEPLCEEALQAAQAVGDRQIETDALNLLGMCADYRGNLDASRSRYEQSLLLARAVGHDRNIARALHNLSAIAQDLGDLDKALQYEREAVAMLERYGTPRAFLLDLADLHLIRGDIETAYSICREIVEGLIAGRELWMVRECLFVFAQLHFRRGHALRAARLLGFTSTLEAELAPRQPTIQEMYVKFVQTVHDALPEAAYAAAHTEGTLFSITDAVAEANLPL